MNLESWDSETHQIDTQMGKLYLTVNFNKVGTPIAILLNISKSGAESNYFADAIARLITLGLQHGISLSSLVKELKDVGGRYDTPTVPDAVALLLHEYVKKGKGKKGDSKASDM